MAFDYAPNAFEYPDVPAPESIIAVVEEFEEDYTFRAQGGIVTINPLNFDSALSLVDETPSRVPADFVELDASVPYSSKLNIYLHDGAVTSYGLYAGITETPPLAIKSTFHSDGSTEETPMSINDLAVMIMTVSNHRASQPEAGTSEVA